VTSPEMPTNADGRRVFTFMALSHFPGRRPNFVVGDQPAERP